ncbi:VOC family protein [Sphingomonas gilva]|uniref:VOC family protein n=1 Tax=Sphingomonas gilva TaxID=2305907 RepID=A0A396RZ39_9SPHN|nr:VOC family protein [Sphingomonas gilva]RHW19001.1 VOC family protein [Sphingomonas gilva]
MSVQGIGGLFFRARDPDALNAWYREHLGIGAGCCAEGTDDPDEWFWKTEGGPTVFAPFKATTDYFAADKQWMINLRVTDLEGMLEQLNASGIAIETRDEWDTPETGRFARIHDPEGNAIELWEPPAT